MAFNNSRFQLLSTRQPLPLNFICQVQKLACKAQCLINARKQCYQRCYLKTVCRITSTARIDHTEQVCCQLYMRMQNAVDEFSARGQVFGTHTSPFDPWYS